MNPDAFLADVLEKYSEHVNPGLARLVSFAGFGVEVFAEGCTITDQDGRKFLDCLGGYGTFALGHRHPKVVQAVKDQLDKQPLSGKAFMNKPLADLAAALAERAPKGLKYSFFCNSGTEAVEGALKLAKGATGRAKIVSTEDSYHGKTLGALATTGREKYRKKFYPLMPGVEFIPFGDAEAAVKAIDADTACMIVEVIQGEGGIHIAPPGYLAAIRKRCDEVGALFILDEVQTGIGRTGTLFGCEHDGVSPDIMPLAKALGGGVMPIGAVMGTEKVWDAVFGENPLLHTSTFGGNQLACAAALATLEVIEEEGLLENCRTRGEQLLRGLQGVAERSDLVAEARGRGLMIGVDVCVAYTLNNPRVLRFEPPLTINADQVDHAVATFEEAVAETSDLLAMLA